jgi:hypothetical protein
VEKNAAWDRAAWGGGVVDVISLEVSIVESLGGGRGLGRDDLVEASMVVWPCFGLVNIELLILLSKEKVRNPDWIK